MYGVQGVNGRLLVSIAPGTRFKSLNYGYNWTLNASFNSRLLASAFTVSGVISKTYDYYADGRLRFSSDLLDHRFDRFYGFDHAARLKEAFSGAEARGEPPTTNRPL